MNKILQLIPADGWSAVFVRQGEKEWELYTIRLSCWALVEEEVAGDTLRSISGFGADDVVDSVDSYSGFMGYLHESDPEGAEKYREDGERYVRRLEEREEKHQRLREAGFRYNTSRGVPKWLCPTERVWLTTREALERLESVA